MIACFANSLFYIFEVAKRKRSTMYFYDWRVLELSIPSHQWDCARCCPAPDWL